MIAEDRREYDFLAGAGVVNYGHDNPLLKQSSRKAARGFVETFKRVILPPRD